MIPDWAETTWDLSVEHAARAVKAAIEDTPGVTLLQATEEDGYFPEYRITIGAQEVRILIEGVDDLEDDATIRFLTSDDDLVSIKHGAQRILREVERAVPFAPENHRHTCLFCMELGTVRQTRAVRTCARCGLDYCYAHGNFYHCVVCGPCGNMVSRRLQLLSEPEPEPTPTVVWCPEGEHPVTRGVRQVEEPDSFGYREALSDRLAQAIDSWIEEDGEEEVYEFLAGSYYQIERDVGPYGWATVVMRDKFERGTLPDTERMIRVTLTPEQEEEFWNVSYGDIV